MTPYGFLCILRYFLTCLIAPQESLDTFRRTKYWQSKDGSATARSDASAPLSQIVGGESLEEDRATVEAARVPPRDCRDSPRDCHDGGRPGGCGRSACRVHGRVVALAARVAGWRARLPYACRVHGHVAGRLAWLLLSRG